MYNGLSRPVDMRLFFEKKNWQRGERARPSSRSSTVAARAPTRIEQLRAPVVQPAPVRGRRRGSDASVGDFCCLCSKSRAKSPSKQASTIEILPRIPRRPTLAAREASGGGGGHTLQQEARNKSGRRRQCRSCSRRRRSGSGGPRRWRPACLLYLVLADGSGSSAPPCLLVLACVGRWLRLAPLCLLACACLSTCAWLCYAI